MQSEILADAPSLIHGITNVATGGATVGIPGPGNPLIIIPTFWQRFHVYIIGIGILVALWLIFRK